MGDQKVLKFQKKRKLDMKNMIKLIKMLSNRTIYLHLNMTPANHLIKRSKFKFQKQQKIKMKDPNMDLLQEISLRISRNRAKINHCSR